MHVKLELLQPNAYHVGLPRSISCINVWPRVEVQSENLLFLTGEFLGVAEKLSHDVLPRCVGYTERV